MTVYPAAQVVLASAALVVAVAVLLLVWRRALDRIAAKAGPFTVEVDAVRKLDEVHSEVKPNGGSSLRDAVDRIERKVDGLNSRVEALEGKVT